jgi:hypothetical protein
MSFLSVPPKNFVAMDRTTMFGFIIGLIRIHGHMSNRQ